MRAADEGIVDDDDVAGVEPPDHGDGGPDGLQHRAQMHRHVLGLGDELRLGVEDGAGRIHALLDVGRERRELQDATHLLGRGLERIAQHLERDRIERTRVSRHVGALHEQHAAGMHLGTIARIEHRGGGYLFDHGRPGNLVARQQLVARQHLGDGPTTGIAGIAPLEEHPAACRSVPLSAVRGLPAASVGNAGVSTLPIAVAPKPTISMGASGSAWPNLVRWVAWKSSASRVQAPTSWMSKAIGSS